MLEILEDFTDVSHLLSIASKNTPEWMIDKWIDILYNYNKMLMVGFWKGEYWYLVWNSSNFAV